MATSGIAAVRRAFDADPANDFAVLKILYGLCAPLPAAWSIEEQEACFTVRDANGQALAYVYFEEEPGRRPAAKLLTRDGARRIAANIDKLPELLLLPGRCRIFATVLKQNRALFLTTHEPCKYQASV